MSSKICLGCIILCCLLIVLNRKQSNKIFNKQIRKKLTWEESQTTLKKGALVIDTRTVFEFNVDHYPKAIHLPVDQIRRGNAVLPDNKDQNIIIYCNTGKRAKDAVDKMRDLGYKNSYYVDFNHVFLKCTGLP
ncbi:rhodanese-like domain-containing protein [Tetraselmis virus 1]|uniref:Rhodanese-like domain-containing protein n=1 Tax=Tetraselmis virus 1 TaxID=2060617 RepID=A0A2P0VMZ4_9VIRU|nr:rhodanese-like domain-containing protein [Tetraselmis virus 1]AUF82272.1 rhodanese-like domain-containing protein [Tetraselmis virus 1]